MKIVFIGTVQFSRAALLKLLALNADIQAVITRPDSGNHADYANIATICKKARIVYRQTNDINTRSIKKFIKKLSPDYIFCFGWSQILDEELLKIPRKGTIGFHPALLPRNRGRHPIVWALALGLKKTGSSFFLMDKGADTGDIISQKTVRITHSDDAATLYAKIIKTATLQIGEFFPRLLNGKIKKTTQRGRESNVWRKRTQADGRIDWRMSASAIHNLVRALTKPYVGAHFLYKKKEIKVWELKEISDTSDLDLEPGKILKVYSDKSFVITTGDKSVLVSKFSPTLVFTRGDYL